MIRRPPLLPLFGLLAGAALLSCGSRGSSTSDPPQGPGDFVIELEHDGRERRYFVHVPPAYERSRPIPVVLAFHGGGGRPETQIRASRMNEKADSAGFLAVYPEGTGPSLLGRIFATWNVGRCCGYARDEKVDDVGFVAAVIDDLRARFDVDSRRVYATGHSNGALMTYRLACELSDRVAAIAPNAGHDALDGCQPSRPVPVIHFHGTADPAARYDGGHCGGRQKDPGWKCRSVPEYLATWRRLDRCAETATTLYEQGDARCRAWSECADGSEVVLCTIEGGGHTWPGGAYTKETERWRQAVGPLSHDLSANDLLWEFFQRHPLPR